MSREVQLQTLLGILKDNGIREAKVKLSSESTDESIKGNSSILLPEGDRDKVHNVWIGVNGDFDSVTEDDLEAGNIISVIGMTEDKYKSKYTSDEYLVLKV